MGERFEYTLHILQEAKKISDRQKANRTNGELKAFAEQIGCNPAHLSKALCLFRKDLWKNVKEKWREERAVIETMTQAGKTGREIAKSLGVSAPAVSGRRLRMGLDQDMRIEEGSFTLREQRIHERRLKVKQMRLSGMTQTAIAEELGVSVSVVHWDCRQL